MFIHSLILCYNYLYKWYAKTLVAMSYNTDSLQKPRCKTCSIEPHIRSSDLLFLDLSKVHLMRTSRKPVYVPLTYTCVALYISSVVLANFVCSPHAQVCTVHSSACCTKNPYSYYSSNKMAAPHKLPGKYSASNRLRNQGVYAVGNDALTSVARLHMI